MRTAEALKRDGCGRRATSCWASRSACSSYYALTTRSRWYAQQQLRDSSSDVTAFASEDRPRELGRRMEPCSTSRAGKTEDQAYWNALAEGGVFGRIVIPDIQLDVLVVKGVRPADLRRGPGWIDWSDLPGPDRRRAAYPATARPMAPRSAGSTSSSRARPSTSTRRTAVTGTRSRKPSSSRRTRPRSWRPTRSPCSLSTACHPPYSARYRIAVQADLVEVRRIEDTGE